MKIIAQVASPQTLLRRYRELIASSTQRWDLPAREHNTLTRTLGLALGLLLPLAGPAIASTPIREGEMAGYLLVPNEKVPTTYNAGFSLYVAAWPLLEEYPGHQFQSGLPGTWMFAQYDGPAPTNLYADIEGGLGWWRDTRFATVTPKFIMGGVAPNFSEWANGRARGKTETGTNQRASMAWHN